MSRDQLVILALIVAAAAALRFQRLGADSLWEDEAASVLYARLPAAVLLTHNVDPGNPPGYRLLLKLWIGLLGDDEWSVRSLSAWCGLATIPAVWVLARQLTHCGATALAAAAALALAPYHIHVSQEARAYALAVLLSVVSTSLLLDALRRGGGVRWTAYAVAASLIPYVHYQGLLVLLGQSAVGGVAWLMARRSKARSGSVRLGGIEPAPVRAHREMRTTKGDAREQFEPAPGFRPGGFLLSQAGIAAALIPCVVLYLGRGMLRPGGYSGWQGPTSWRGLAHLLAKWTLGSQGVAWLPASLEPWQIVMCVAALLLPGVLFALRRRREGPQRWLEYALLLYVGVGVLVVVTLWKPVWHPKYLTAWQPLYLIGLASVITFVPRSPQGLRPAAAGVVTLGFAAGLLPGVWYMRTHPWKPDYRGAAAHICAHDPSAGVPVLVYKAAYLAVDYYCSPCPARLEPPRELLRATRGAPAEGAVLAALVASRSPRIRTGAELEEFLVGVSTAVVEAGAAYVVLSESQLGGEWQEVLEALAAHAVLRQHLSWHRVHVIEVGP